MTDDPDSSTDPGDAEGRDSLPTRREPAVGAEDARVGSVFDDRYRIQKRIGAGGMGVVYRAVHESLDRTVVIKVLTEEKLHDSVSVQRFEREAKSLSRLDHSNIVTVYDFGREGELPYLAMEHVDGIELRAMLDDGEGMDLQLFSVIASQILDGMAHAHRKGLVHRDLKPSNIMLTERDENPYFVKLLDFGLAKLVSGGKDVTAENRVVGSMAYLAPEQLTGSSVDQRADVYSLGIVFYWMLTGRKPFQGSRASIVYDQIHSDPPPLALQLPAGTRVSDNLVALIERCMSKDPTDRPRSAGDLQARLEETTDGIRVDEIPTDELEASPSGPARSRRETPGAGARSRRQTPSRSRTVGGGPSRTAEARPPEPGTESSELVDEYQTDDLRRGNDPREASEMSVQEALESARETADPEPVSEERDRAGGRRERPYWVLGAGAALAIGLLGAVGWYLTLEGTDGAATAERDRAAALERKFDRLEQLIDEGQFEEAASRISELRAAVASRAGTSDSASWRRRLKVRQLYVNAEMQRRAGTIGPAMSTYAELLEVEPDYRDASEKLETLESYGLLKIETDRTATVRIDEETVGEPPVSQLVAPGEHEVLLEVDGEEAWAKTVAIDEDETVALAPVLTQKTDESKESDGRRVGGSEVRTAGESEESDESEDRTVGGSEESDESEGRTVGESEDRTDRGSEGADESGESEASGTAEESGASDEESGGAELLEPGEGGSEGTGGESSTEETGADDGEDSETELLPVQ